MLDGAGRSPPRQPHPKADLPSPQGSTPPSPTPLSRTVPKKDNESEGGLGKRGKICKGVAFEVGVTPPILSYITSPRPKGKHPGIYPYGAAEPPGRCRSRELDELGRATRITCTRATMGGTRRIHQLFLKMAGGAGASALGKVLRGGLWGLGVVLWFGLSAQHGVIWRAACCKGRG